MTTPTTRRHPRTLREAFRDADYACAVERPAYSRCSDSIVAWACSIAALALAIILIWE